MPLIAGIFSPPGAEPIAPGSADTLIAFFTKQGYVTRIARPAPALSLVFAFAPGEAEAVAPDLPIHREGPRITFGVFDLYGSLSDGEGWDRGPVAQAARLLAAHGRDGPSRLVGDFILGQFDTDARELSLYRDQMGVRSLSYTLAGGQLIFASTIPALLQVQSVPRDVSRRSLAEFLLAGEPLGDSTHYNGIRHLLPATRLHVGGTQRGEVRLRRYWRPGRSNFSRGLPRSGLVPALRDLVDECVLSRLPPTGPIGVLLSGGLDSSLVAAIACKRRPDRQFISATAVTPQNHSGPEKDERAYVAALAKRYPNLSIHFDEGVAGDVFEVGPGHLLNGPQGNPASWSARRQLRYLQSRGVTTVLSGDGGDYFLSNTANAYISHQILRLRLPSAWKEFQRRRAIDYMPATQLLKHNLIAPFIPMRLMRLLWKSKSIDWTENTALRREVFDSLNLIERIEETDRDTYLHAGPTLRRDFLDTLESSTLGGGFSYDETDLFGLHTTLQLPLIDLRIVEAVLDMPADLFISGQQDRGLIRRVAGPDLPQCIASRTTKGHAHPSFRTNLRKINSQLAEEIRRYQTDPLWSSLVDMSRVEHELADLTREQPGSPDTTLFACLFRPIALGRFLETQTG